MYRLCEESRAYEHIHPPCATARWRPSGSGSACPSGRCSRQEGRSQAAECSRRSGRVSFSPLQQAGWQGCKNSLVIQVLVPGCKGDGPLPQKQGKKCGPARISAQAAVPAKAAALFPFQALESKTPPWRNKQSQADCGDSPPGSKAGQTKPPCGTCETSRHVATSERACRGRRACAQNQGPPAAPLPHAAAAVLPSAAAGGWAAGGNRAAAGGCAACGGVMVYAAATPGTNTECESDQAQQHLLHNSTQEQRTSATAGLCFITAPSSSGSPSLLLCAPAAPLQSPLASP